MTREEYFWIYMIDLYIPMLLKLQSRSLLPFVSTYLCDYGCSETLLIKTTHRNLFQLKDDVRCALSETSRRMHKLIKIKQCQASIEFE